MTFSLYEVMFNRLFTVLLVLASLIWPGTIFYLSAYSSASIRSYDKMWFRYEKSNKFLFYLRELGRYFKCLFAWIISLIMILASIAFYICLVVCLLFPLFVVLFCGLYVGVSAINFKQNYGALATWLISLFVGSIGYFFFRHLTAVHSSMQMILAFICGIVSGWLSKFLLVFYEKYPEKFQKAESIIEGSEDYWLMDKIFVEVPWRFLLKAIYANLPVKEVSCY